MPSNFVVRFIKIRSKVIIFFAMCLHQKKFQLCEEVLEKIRNNDSDNHGRLILPNASTLRLCKIRYCKSKNMYLSSEVFQKSLELSEVLEDIRGF